MVISLRGSIPLFSPEARLGYHAIMFEMAIVMVTYIIRTYPGT